MRTFISMVLRTMRMLLKGPAQETSQALIAEKKFSSDLEYNPNLLSMINSCKNSNHINQMGMFVTSLEGNKVIDFDEYLFLLDTIAHQHEYLMKQKSKDEPTNKVILPIK